MVKEIEYEELEKLGDYQLVDVRTNEEREEFHIGGIHLENGNGFERLDPEKNIVVYCRAGVRSWRAAEMIERELEAKSVYSLAEGISQQLGKI